MDLNHSPEQVLAVGRNEVRNVEDAALNLLQKLSQIVVVKREGADEQGVEDHSAGPDIRLLPIVLLTLSK